MRSLLFLHERSGRQSILPCAIDRAPNGRRRIVVANHRERFRGIF
jgi:hypothetical protein